MAHDPSNDLIQAFETLADSRVARVHAVWIAKVSEYDHATKRAKVVPIVRRSYRDADGNVQTMKTQALADVPVLELGSSTSGFAVTFPLSVGDEGILLINDRSLAEYLQTGNDTTEPQVLRRWDARDALFLPMFFRAAKANDRATGVTVVQGDEVRLGSSTASDYVALATNTSNRINTLVTQVQAMATVYNAHVHTGNLGAPTSPPAVPQVNPTSTTASEFAATKVKGE